MKYLYFVLAVVVLVLISACVNLSPSRGKLTVYLTDAVLTLEDVQRIDVTIDKISLEGETGSVYILDQATTVNLLELVGSQIVLATVEVSGSFTQLRFDISQATITVNDQEHELTVASKTLRYPFKGELQINSDAVLVLDFDLSRSIKKDTGAGQGGNQGYLMTPVIHLRHGNGELYDIKGKIVKDGCGKPDALVALTDESTVVAVTFSHEESEEWREGEFRLVKIKPGEYTIKVFLKEKYECWEDDIANLIMQETPDATEAVNLQQKDLDVGEISV